MTGSSEDALRDLLAREAVRDVIYLYCRAVDRADEAALRDCYWPDATDDHGAFRGPANVFLDWAATVLPTTKRGIHQIHNILLEVKEDGIAGESYFTAYDLRPDPQGVFHQWLIRGRYLDWFVQREGTWKILNRVVVFDWVEELPQLEGSEEERFGVRQPIGGKHPHDPVYDWFARAR